MYRYLYLSARSVSEADGLHHHQGELDRFLRPTVDIIDIDIIYRSSLDITDVEK